ncbi:MAG: class I SAM-dependent methyltransferase [Clostridia bacterium]|nr:class I SAM-dependent methyltransferase [Clostridia bacterium]
MSLHRYIAKQLGNPTGFGGKLVASVMTRQNRPLYDETIRLLSPSDSDYILDIGCGNGYVLNLIARQCNGALTGIDTSASMIRAASRRNNQMIFVCQDASAMSFADGSFDKAYSINTVYFWSDLQKTMTEIRRVLKPGGLFINTLYANETLARLSHTQFGYKRYTTEELRNHVGFTVDAVPILDGAGYCFVYQAERN